VSAREFARWLVPIGWIVLVGGWAVAIVSFFAIGTETCTMVDVPIVGGAVEACTDTTTSAVTLTVVVGFAATLGSVFLWALRYMLLAMESVADNTRSRDR
jgi:hypothetical protein